MQERQFFVDGALHHTTLASSDLAKLHREATWRVVAPCAWFHAVQHFGAWVEVLETLALAQQRDSMRWEIKVDFSQRLAGDFRQFLIGNSLEERLADVCGGQQPLSQDSFGACNLLAAPLAGSNVFGDSLGLNVLEAPEA